MTDEVALALISKRFMEACNNEELARYKYLTALEESGDWAPSPYVCRLRVEYLGAKEQRTALWPEYAEAKGLL